MKPCLNLSGVYIVINWRLPPDNHFKMSVGAVVGGVSCFIGIGAIIRDSHGFVMEPLTNRLSGFFTVLR